MNVALLSVTVIAFLIFFFVLGKRSVISIGGNAWSLLFYKEIFFIVPSVFFISIYGVESFRTFFLAESEKSLSTSWMVIYCVITFISIIGLASFLGFNKEKFMIKNTDGDIKESREILIFGYSAILTGVILLVFSILFLGYKHAFITTIITGESLIKARLANTYSSNLPSQASYLLSISIFISTIFTVYLFKVKKKFVSLVVISCTFFMATADGAKDSVLNVLIILFASFFYFMKPKVNIVKLIVLVVSSLSLSLLLLFYVVSLQVPNLDWNQFFLYLVERIGVDQMAGTYETFSIQLNSTSFGWHAVPFAHLFVDYPVFSKELMLLSEGGAYDSTGVKNSLFVAEAFGMGGWELALASPFIFSFGYLVKLVVIYFSLKTLFSKVVSRIFTLPLLFLTTKLTGDLSSIVLQKGTLLLLIVFVSFFIVSLVVRGGVKVEG